MTMKYISTQNSQMTLTFEEALMSTGFLPDGGLALPASIPAISAEVLQEWSKLSYPDIVKQVTALFVSEEEIPKDDLSAIVDKAYGPTFRHPDICPMVKLKSSLNIHELFHGKTYAFKDLAMSGVVQFMDYFLNKRKRHMTMLIGTSGDTGSSCLEAARHSKWLDIVVLLPKGRCSEIQELMMTTVTSDNCHVYRVEGTSDDLDQPIKACFMDEKLAKTHHLCSANSINWGRVMIQIAHYFYGYFQICSNIGETVEIVVPTGACGNVAAGVIAWKMGLPVRLTTAVNVNDIVARTLSKGDFSVKGEVLKTLSPAMDIQLPYNMQRLFFLFSDGDTGMVKQLMDDFDNGNGALQIPEDLLKKMQQVMNSFSATDSTVKETMVRCWEENGYLLCPHTAVAAAYHYSMQDKIEVSPRRASNSFCIATASPAKFREAVEEAGLEPQIPDEVRELHNMPQHYVDMKKGEDWETILREKISDITERANAKCCH